MSSTNRILTDQQITFYRDEGYFALPRLIDDSWLERLNRALAALVERSRSLTASDGTFDLETGHSAQAPRLRRIAFLDDLDPVFWEFAVNGVIPDLVADLVGPDVTFRECMVNYKWAGGGQEVKWHQDIPFYPHTNLTPLQVLIALDEVTSEQGPLQVIPRSHLGPVYDHYDSAGRWTGPHRSVRLGRGPARSCAGLDRPSRLRHGPPLRYRTRIAPEREQTRPAGVDSRIQRRRFPSLYRARLSQQSPRHRGPGQAPTHARHDAVTLRLPPDWSGGYTSIFQHQEN